MRKTPFYRNHPSWICFQLIQPVIPPRLHKITHIHHAAVQVKPLMPPKAYHLTNAKSIPTSDGWYMYFFIPPGYSLIRYEISPRTG
ncbi:MAG: hypothetical protein IPM26_17070 [Saprospiraceae bacterium]|nr:hypothetical protein [Saprospiraceae bacterium]